MHRQMRQLRVVQVNAATISLDQADDHVEARRLAGAIRAQQADHLATAYLEGHVLDDSARLVAFVYAFNPQQAHRIRLSTTCE